ncbi:class I SAM-dependent methyltransferase [Chitinophaga pinensis]|uniref:Methyltransferase type 12 n=1 Tax=Chitinophaga pinensis (strain ATCC 43595 / DSM 2588 / LMG 13176 / NBRC 15968 / NCIMB 11800 / UQM 2034) TaxID=485918 RepID=A0A979G7Y7_CHIPD|nr:class I SAM-dependent methyltransferase [Chitinophaga pinensis]ACU62440.1 Methyltransferase type 12 [Chitinophaga pinensis DSM 2588]
MKNNYDNIARYYDLLSGVVFGSAQQDAQTALLSYIPPDSNILIAGGGTGWILERIAAKCAPGQRIYYVEISANMIARAKEQPYQPNEVHFIHLAIEDFNLAQTDITGFDIIITPFLFDNFKAERIPDVFRHLDSLLLSGGRWLFTDFHYRQQAPYWQQLLLNSMYLFFRILCAVEASALANVRPLFTSAGYTLEQEVYYFKKFIWSAVYRKRQQ